MTISADAAHDLFNRSIVIDGLAGTSFAFDALHASGLTAANLTLAAHNDSFLRAVEWLKDYFAGIEAHADKLLLVRSAADIRRAKAEGRLGLILGFQTAGPVEDDVTNLWVFAQLGIRIVQVTYNQRNLMGSGCYEDNDTGLTYLGKTFVREMNRLGLLVDLSHCGWKTAADVLEVAQQPLVLSHSNPDAKCPISRNVPDELIQGVAATGGVIGMNAHPALCATRPGKRPTLEDFLDVLDYTVNLVGVDHVGLGLDLFEGFAPWQHFRWDRRYDELDNPWGSVERLAVQADMRGIAPGLAERGYTETDIEKILGLNLLRVFDKVWKSSMV
jgi:membrane dipeptidase